MSGEPVLEAFGHLSSRMLAHILLMNAVAPLLALAASRTVLSRSGSPGQRRVFPAMLVQLAVLWAWHAPPVLDATMQSGTLHLAMQASLLLSATWFWSAVLANGEEGAWRAILALLVTSKLFCLLGVLLVFAPRTLYYAVPAAHGHVAAQPAPMLADQQLAGLLMLVACPITYIVAGIVIAGRWLTRLEAAGQPGSRRQNAWHAV